jgi:hypothetical protein
LICPKSCTPRLTSGAEVHHRIAARAAGAQVVGAVGLMLVVLVAAQSAGDGDEIGARDCRGDR